MLFLFAKFYVKYLNASKYYSMALKYLISINLKPKYINISNDKNSLNKASICKKILFDDTKYLI